MSKPRFLTQPIANASSRGIAIYAAIVSSVALCVGGVVAGLTITNPPAGAIVVLVVCGVALIFAALFCVFRQHIVLSIETVRTECCGGTYVLATIMYAIPLLVVASTGFLSATPVYFFTGLTMVVCLVIGMTCMADCIVRVDVEVNEDRPFVI